MSSSLESLSLDSMTLMSNFKPKIKLTSYIPFPSFLSTSSLLPYPLFLSIPREPSSESSFEVNPKTSAREGYHYLLAIYQLELGRDVFIVDFFFFVLFYFFISCFLFLIFVDIVKDMICLLESRIRGRQCTSMIFPPPSLQISLFCSVSNSTGPPSFYNNKKKTKDKKLNL